MHEIDLIPAHYRARRELLAALQQYGLLAGALVLFGIGATGVLYAMNQSLTDDIRELQGEQAITDQQRLQLEGLRTQKNAQEQQHELLKQLRSGTSAQEIFQVLDRALGNDDVWFRKWSFKRAMEPLDESQITLRQQNGEEGFFIMIPIGLTDREYWEVRTHMEIDGEARDHSALSQFVASLYQQDPIEDVKVLETALQQERDREFVKFRLAILVGPGSLQTESPY